MTSKRISMRYDEAWTLTRIIKAEIIRLNKQVKAFRAIEKEDGKLLTTDYIIKERENLQRLQNKIERQHFPFRAHRREENGG